MKKFPLIIISFIILSQVVGSQYPLIFAASSQFTVTQTVDETPDVTAPSIPTGLSATAVSTSQIDLIWNASTDDTAVTDYRIYRDNVFVATSGGVTTYSDSGLSPNTTYSYTVTAIDAANNESGNSAPASATTFPETTPTTNPGDGGSSFVLKYLNVSPDLREAVIRFGTSEAVRAVVYWGQTRDLELGSLASALYLTDQVVHLTELTPGTHYFFKIELIDGRGHRRVIDNQDFYTLSLPDTTPPDNVTNFKASEKDGDVVLTWKNPQVDFDTVRIVKSDIFYPRDPSEGEVIFEGRTEEFTDTHVEAGNTYYYSAFAKDRSGNFASGAVTDITLSRAGEKPGRTNLFAGVLQLPKELIDPLFRKLSLLDINFIQDGVKLPVVSGVVEIRGDRSLTISIDYNKVPEILKTIAVTIYDPNDKDKTFSFLLRVNKDKTAYEANIAPFERPGKYAFDLAILDYKHQGLVKLSGAIIARIPLVFVEHKAFFSNPINLLWLLVLLLMFFVMWFVFRKRKKEQPQVTSEKQNVNK